MGDLGFSDALSVVALLLSTASFAYAIRSRRDDTRVRDQEKRTALMTELGEYASKADGFRRLIMEEAQNVDQFDTPYKSVLAQVEATRIEKLRSDGFKRLEALVAKSQNLDSLSGIEVEKLITRARIEYINLGIEVESARSRMSKIKWQNERKRKR